MGKPFYDRLRHGCAKVELHEAKDRRRTELITVTVKELYSTTIFFPGVTIHCCLTCAYEFIRTRPSGAAICVTRLACCISESFVFRRHSRLEEATYLRAFRKIARRKLMLMQQFSLPLTTCFNLNSEIRLREKENSARSCIDTINFLHFLYLNIILFDRCHSFFFFSRVMITLRGLNAQAITRARQQTLSA